MELKLKSLTPIHIGNGEELYELDYVVHSGKFYRITQKKFLEFIKSDKDLVNKYALWVSEKSTDIQELEEKKKNENDKNRRLDYNQTLTTLRKEFSLDKFCQANNQRDNFIRFLNFNCNGISSSMPEGKGQVRGHIKDGKERFYLPGTSIKGAIRSAIIYDLLQLPENRQKIQSSLIFQLNDLERVSDQRYLDKAKKKFADEVEQHLVYCAVETEGNRIKKDDEKFDVFKLLSVSDAYSSENDCNLYKINLYLVEKIHNNTSVTTKATEQKQAPYVETFGSDNEFIVQLDFNIDFVLSIKNLIVEKEGEKSFVLQNGKKTWIGIKEKLEQVFGIKISELNIENKEEIKENILRRILSLIAVFSKKQKEADQKWADNFVRHDSDRKFGSKITKGFDAISKTEFVLHMGYATGFNGITEILALKEDDSLKPLLKRYMEKFLIGDKPGAAKTRRHGDEYTANPDNFPKSRRLAVTGNDIITPLGWLQIMNFQEKETVEEEKKVEIQYPRGTVKQRTEVMATVIKSGIPNKVKVHIRPDYEPELDITGYRAALPIEKEGKPLWVVVQQISKDKITQISFSKF